ncbi:MAG: hypothetical protein WA667_19435 [Candidatus Nitrosopolaris sp.]
MHNQTHYISSKLINSSCKCNDYNPNGGRARGIESLRSKLSNKMTGAGHAVTFNNHGKCDKNTGLRRMKQVRK